jgi:hypothetical protein
MSAIKNLTIQFHLDFGYWLRLYMSVNLLVGTIIILVSNFVSSFWRLHFVGVIMHLCEHMEERYSDSFFLVDFSSEINLKSIVVKNILYPRKDENRTLLVLNIMQFIHPKKTL